MKQIIVFIFLFFTLIVNAQKTIFVNFNNNTPLKDGLSWQTAFNNLQMALTFATPNTQVWIAKGTYFPTNDTNRDTAFIVNKGIKIYGSFEGNEKSIYERNLDKNITILSGNIGNKSDSLDNSYNIIRCINCDSTTIIDGFQIENGYAYNNDIVEPVEGNRKCGSGIFIDGISYGINASPIIKNCIFLHNAAITQGGAIYYFQDNKSNGNLIIINCFFRNNKSYYGSGVYYRSTSSFIQTSLIDSCKFEKNFALSEGASIYLSNENPNQTFKISNSSFTDNIAVSEGGGIMGWFFVQPNYKNFFYLKNCLFDNNIANGGTSLSIFSQFTSIVPKLEAINFINHKSKAICAFYMNPKDTIYYNSCSFKNNNVSSAISGRNIIIDKLRFISNIDTFLAIGAASKNYTKITNSVFINNNLLFRCIGTPKDSARLDVINSFFYYNNSIINSTGTDIFSFDPNKKNYIFSDVNFKNCIFQKNNSTNKNIFNGQTSVTLENCGIDLPNIDDYLNKDKDNGKILIYGKDNIINQYFIDTSTYKLFPCSPAINAGNNALSSDLKTDIDGKPRFRYGKIDIGPYEYDGYDVSKYDLKSTICKSAKGGFLPNVVGNCSASPTISWLNSENKTGIGGENLAEGIYTFFVKDDKNLCTDTIKDVKIESKNLLGISSVNVRGVSKKGETDGFIRIISISNGNAPFQYKWSNGDTTALTKNLTEGTYQVSITDANGCFYTTSYTIGVSTATNDNDESIGLSVFPNPSDNLLTIFWQDKVFDFKLFDTKGKIYFLEKNTREKAMLETSNLTSGFYILQVTDNQDFVRNKKILIQH